MKLVKSLGALSLAAGALTLAGCASSGPTISYTDPNAVQTVSIDYSSTDLQSITNKMVDSMIASPAVEKITAQSTPVLFIGSVQNNSDQHINTQALTNAMSTRLLQSGKFQFVDMSQVEAVKKQLDYQHKSGLVNQKEAVKIGQQVGAQYMFYGDISSISQRNSSEQTLYLQVTMKLMNLQSGLIVWQGEKQISKKAVRSSAGW